MEPVAPKNIFRLSELAREAGVGKETIHYYVRSGVLPRPRKARAKLALYDDNHLALLRLVRRFQREERLPLAYIAKFFRQGGYDARRIELDLIAGAYESGREGRGFLPGGGGGEEECKAESAASAVPDEFLKTLRRAGLLSSNTAAGGDLVADDETLAGVLWAAQQKGTGPEFFARLLGPLRVITEAQRGALVTAAEPETGFQQLVRQAGELDRLINRFIEATKTRLLREEFQQSVEQAPLTLEKLRRRIYVPSRVFLERHQVNQQIEQLAARAKGETKNDVLWASLCDALGAVGRFQEAIEAAQRVDARSREGPNALATQAIAQALLAQTDEAIETIKRALSLAPSDPRVAACGAMAYLIQAARMGGVISPVPWLRRSLGLIERAMGAPAGNRVGKHRLDVLVLAGRFYTVLPGPLGRVREGVAALEEVLRTVESHGDRTLGLPFEGFSEIYRINVYFYLGEAHAREGEAERAREAWQQVLLRDPASNFAKYVYERIEEPIRATG